MGPSGSGEGLSLLGPVPSEMAPSLSASSGEAESNGREFSGPRSGPSDPGRGRPAGVRAGSERVEASSGVLRLAAGEAPPLWRNPWFPSTGVAPWFHPFRFERGGPSVVGHTGARPVVSVSHVRGCRRHYDSEDRLHAFAGGPDVGVDGKEVPLPSEESHGVGAPECDVYPRMDETCESTWVPTG